MIRQATSTTTVPCTTWGRFGQSTFFNSAHDSPMKAIVPKMSPRRGCGSSCETAGTTASPPSTGCRTKRLRCAGTSAAPAARRASRRCLRVSPATERPYRVSRWVVWLPHQRQYFSSSTRSGEFRFDFCVW